MRPITAAGLSLVILAVLAAELLSLGGVLEYRRPLLASEPWRLWTGHFVHLTLVHAMLNAVALLLLERLFAERLRTGEFWLLLGASPVLISLLLWVALRELEWYRGLSGTLHAIYFAGCVVWLKGLRDRARWLPLAALIGGLVKVLLEQPWDASFPFREWLGPVVPQAHLAGAVIGTAAGLVLAARRAGRATRAG